MANTTPPWDLLQGKPDFDNNFLDLEHFGLCPLATFTLLDTDERDEHSLTIDIGDLQTDCLRDAQSGGVTEKLLDGLRTSLPALRQFLLFGLLRDYYKRQAIRGSGRRG
jgi:hypothetical protein